MKHRLRTFLLFLPGLLICGLLYLFFSSPSRFDTFCDTLFCEEMEANALTCHYTLKSPESYGISARTISLGSFTSDTSQQKKWLIKKQLVLKTIAKGRLSEKQRTTCTLLENLLDTELEGLDYTMLKEPLVPSIGIQSQLPILLAEYRFYAKNDVTEYLSLLSCLPQYMDSLIAFEKERCRQGLFPDASSVEELIAYCREFLSDRQSHFLTQTFEERLTPLELSSSERTGFLEKNTALLENAVFPAYEKLLGFLEEHKTAGTNKNGLYYYKNGTKYYDWLLRSEIGTDKNFQEIEALLNQALKHDASVIADLTRKNPHLSEQQAQIHLDTSNPSGLTSYLAKRTSHDFPEIPEVSTEIHDIPASMEPHLSPAFYVVPPLDDAGQNIVYLNNGYLKEGISFFTTLAHESYPGHLYQNVFEHTLNRHPVHRLFYFGGYTEGWATYAEQHSYFYAPVSTELATLLSAARAITLNIYSHLDLYVHAYGWTEEQCKEYLKKFGITGAQTAHNIFLLVKQQPANYLKYYLGYLELCELRKKAEETLGEDFDLKKFHQFVLEEGPAPFWMLEKSLDDFLQLF